MGALGGRSLNSGHAATRAREIQGSGVREHSTLKCVKLPLRLDWSFRNRFYFASAEQDRNQLRGVHLVGKGRTCLSCQVGYI